MRGTEKRMNSMTERQQSESIIDKDRSKGRGRQKEKRKRKR